MYSVERDEGVPPPSELTDTLPPVDPEATPDSGKNRRVATASLMGTLIEGYDLIVYGTAAVLVFSKIFFPALEGAAGTFASLATFAVSFIARPVGSVLFGHFGDRLGRKQTLVATLLLMGAATVAVGLIPPASQIGILAPILLVIARFVQGISSGGEWAGAALFVAEHVPAERRGYFAMFPQLGAVLPLPLSSATFLVINATMSNDDFVNWGWRIPFLASGVLIVVGLWIRLTVDETPVFKNSQKNLRGDSPREIPFVAAFRHQWRQILTAAGVVLTTFAFSYISSTYLNSYAIGTLGIERGPVLLAGLIGGLFYCLGVVFGALLSDKIGRMRTIVLGSSAGAAWALLLFPTIDIGGFGPLLLAMCISFFIAGTVYGPVGAYLPELFATQHRYTATGVSYNLSGVLGGGLIPILAPLVVESSGTVVFSIVLMATCLASVFCTLKLGETRATDLNKV